MSRNHLAIDWRTWALLRRAVLERDGYRCRSCGLASKLECDHIVPLAHGGTNEMANLQALCRTCHIAKTKKQTTTPGRQQFRDYVQSIVDDLASLSAK